MEYINQIIDLFTPAQKLAIVVITLCVMSLTQVFKNIYFGFWPERRKVRKAAIIWLAAFVFGLMGGSAWYFIGVPKQPLWFCLFVGVTSSALAIGTFKLITYLLPKLKLVKN